MAKPGTKKEAAKNTKNAVSKKSVFGIHANWTISCRAEFSGRGAVLANLQSEYDLRNSNFHTG